MPWSVPLAQSAGVATGIVAQYLVNRLLQEYGVEHPLVRSLARFTVAAGTHATTAWAINALLLDLPGGTVVTPVAALTHGTWAAVDVNDDLLQSVAGLLQGILFGGGVGSSACSACGHCSGFASWNEAAIYCSSCGHQKSSHYR